VREPDIKVHLNPVWRQRANYIIRRGTTVS
jgi:hypothetical protein